MSHASVTELSSMCLFSGVRQTERKKGGEECPADVNEDHTVLDNITVYLNHPLPLLETRQAVLKPIASSVFALFSLDQRLLIVRSLKAT